MEENFEKSVNTVRRISSLSEHRALLREVFKTARSRIVVVSPFISSKALASDSIPSQIKSAVGRGVSVQVYTDRKLNCDQSGAFKRSALEGISDMAANGAQVKVVDGIHNKTLARDEDLIAEGSFNWFSAVRVKGGENQREERTMVVQGDQAKEMIEKEVNSMNIKGLSNVVNKNSEKPQLISKKVQVFRLLFVLVLFVFMMVIAFGATEKGVSTLAFVSAGILFLTLIKFLKRPLKATFSNNIDVSSIVITENPDDTSSLINEYDDSITDAGYIGIYEHH